MLIKKISIFRSIIALVSICIFPLSVNASENVLHIYNSTDKGVTFKIDGKTCSTKLGKGGVTKAHTVAEIPATQILKICKNGQKCSAEIYITNDCSGVPIGKLTFALKDGITEINTDAENMYAIAGDSSQLFVRQYA